MGSVLQNPGDPKKPKTEKGVFEIFIWPMLSCSGLLCHFILTAGRSYG